MTIGTGAITIPGVTAADNEAGRARGRSRDHPGNASGKSRGNNKLPPENHPAWDNVHWEEGEWSDESGEFSWDEVDTEDWVVEFNPYKISSSLTTFAINGPSNKEVYVGKNKNASPSEVEIQTYAIDITLLEKTIPSEVPELGGEPVEVRLRGKASLSGAGFEVHVCVSGDCLNVLGFVVEPHKDSGICMEVSPGKFPLEVKPCLHFAWEGPCSVNIGGEINLCVPQEDPCGRWYNCQWCASEDLSFNLHDDVIGKLWPELNEECSLL